MNKSFVASKLIRILDRDRGHFGSSYQRSRARNGYLQVRVLKTVSYNIEKRFEAIQRIAIILV